MLKKEAREITGGLSKPSKMPGPAHNLPAWRCITGVKLQAVKNSVCAGCYAMKGRYRFNNVKAALDRRLQALEHPRWVDAMVTLISGEPWFRWHDSGDIQSVQHLKNIFEVCKATPNTIHWLPTREAQILKQVDKKDVPDNLVIRLSAIKVDGNAPKSWDLTSTVSTKKYTCMANKQGGKCLDCRACWDKKIKNIIYPLH